MRDQATTDEGSKLRVKEALLEHASAALRSLVGEVAAERRGAELDQQTPREADASSQAYEAGELEGRFEDAAVRQRERVAQIEELDFAPTDVVASGAIVEFGGQRYVVGVVSDPFDCDGVTYEGIATDAPVYADIEGLRVGDTFSFDGREHRIDHVS